MGESRDLRSQPVSSTSDWSHLTVLQLNNVSLADGGTYACTAELRSDVADKGTVVYRVAVFSLFVPLNNFCLAAGFHFLAAGFHFLAAGFYFLAAGYNFLAAGFPFLAVAGFHFLIAAGCYFLAAGFHFLAAGFHFPATWFHFLAAGIHFLAQGFIS